MRKSIPRKIQADLLIQCGRKCCLCVFLEGDSGVQKLQIAHVDRDAANNSPENLVPLCLRHHDEYDSIPSQSKGFSPLELKHYWDLLVDYVDASRSHLMSKPSEKEKADPSTARRMAEKIVAAYETPENQLLSLYIPLRFRGATAHRKVQDGDLMTFISGWLNDATRPHLALLADFGYGKTSFCRHLEYELARKYLADDSGCLGVLIPLKNLMITHTVSDHPIDQIMALLSLPKELQRERLAQIFGGLDPAKIVLLLDGFDEMSTRVFRNTRVNGFKKIEGLLELGASVILTARTHYFPTTEDLRQTFGMAEEKADPLLLYMQDRRYKFHDIFLTSLNRDQIRQYFGRKFGKSSQEFLKKALAIYDLSELMKQPLLLNLICQTLPFLDQDEGEITSARLYQVFIDLWLNREGWRLNLTKSDVQRLMEILAGHFYEHSRSAILYSELPGLMEEHFGKISNEAVTALDSDLRTCTFLSRDDEGRYSFIHKSFMEYFLARAAVEGRLGKKVVDRFLQNELEVLIFLLELEGNEEKRQETLDRSPWCKKKVGRNDPCPCGSGKKYKKCHSEAEGRLRTRAKLLGLRVVESGPVPPPSERRGLDLDQYHLNTLFTSRIDPGASFLEDPPRAEKEPPHRPSRWSRLLGWLRSDR